MHSVSFPQFIAACCLNHKCFSSRLSGEPCFACSARILPEKLTVYTTLVGLLNARNYNFGGEFVEAMIRQLKETLKNNLYNEAVYLVSGSLTSVEDDARSSFSISPFFFFLAAGAFSVRLGQLPCDRCSFHGGHV